MTTHELRDSAPPKNGQPSCGRNGAKRKRSILIESMSASIEQPSAGMLANQLSSAPYLGAAVTDFTEMVSPFAVPVTLACCQASLLSSFSAALSDVLRVYTLPSTTKAY